MHISNEIFKSEKIFRIDFHTVISHLAMMEWNSGKSALSPSAWSCLESERARS